MRPRAARAPQAQIERLDRPSPFRPPAWRIAFQDLHIVRRGEHRVSQHLHPHHELLFIRRGRWEGSIDGLRLAAVAPALVAVGPGQHHSDAYSGPIEMTALHLAVLPGPAPGRSAPLLARNASAVYRLDIALHDDLAILLAAMAACIRRGDAGAGPQLDALASAAAWRWLGGLDPGFLAAEIQESVEADTFSAALLRCCEEHRRSDLGLAAMAEALGLSPRTLSWRCRRHFGMPPTRLHRIQRLLAAQDMLYGSNTAIGVVAAHFGFASAAHFSTAYRRHFGIPPQEGRRMPPLPQQ